MIQLLTFKTIPSTNDHLKQLSRELKDNQDMIVCLAEHQTQGRGRFDRVWHSPSGKNIYLSCLYPFQKESSQLEGLSLVVGLAIAEILNAYHPDKPFYVKWPNDVVYFEYMRARSKASACTQGGESRFSPLGNPHRAKKGSAAISLPKKIAGVLIEMQSANHGVDHVIIGIGINVNMMRVKDSITQPWISLKKVTGQEVDRNTLSTQLIDTLSSYLKTFDLHGLQSFQPAWQERDLLSNQAIALQCADQTLSGTMRGINEQGHLLLQLETGVIKSFSSGEVSITKGMF